MSRHAGTALLPAWCESFSGRNMLQAQGVAGSIHHTHAESLRVMAQQGTAGDTHHHLSPLALGAEVSSRSWEGSISMATGTKKTVPRITKPSGRTAAGCSLLSRWVTPTQRPPPGGGEGGGMESPGARAQLKLLGEDAEDKPQNLNELHTMPAFSRPGEL